MGDNLRQHFPFATPSSDHQARVHELTRTKSDSSDSGVTVESFRDPTANAQPGQTMVWTDEKHNAYLDFLEGSFVKQLHYSRSLHGCHPPVGMWEPCPFPQQPAEEHNSCQQFSILQDGCDQKINNKSNDPFLESTADSGFVLESPWLHHFMFASKSSSTSIPVPRETVVPNERIYLKSNTNFSCKSAINSEQKINSCSHSLDSCIAEVSFQNFVDEDQGDKATCMSRGKRLKMTTVFDASSNSQVVSVGKLCTTDYSSNQQNVCKKREKETAARPPK